MSGKKHEEIAIRMPDSDREKDPFLGTTERRSPMYRQQPKWPQSMSKVDQSPPLSILAYCLSSISMTVVNKYVVSGSDWNLNFFYLAVQVRIMFSPHRSVADQQAIVCTLTILGSKQAGLMRNLAPYDSDKAKKCLLLPRHRQRYSIADGLRNLGFPISVLLVGMIYTSTKALQFLSVPVYTIFKNLTIIVIAYGEVLWFGGSVTPLALLSFGLMVLSSVVAAWADIQSAIHGGTAASVDASVAISTLNAGYTWMGLNVFCTASYVLGMKKVIKKMNLKDHDSRCARVRGSIPTLT